MIQIYFFNLDSEFFYCLTVACSKYIDFDILEYVAFFLIYQN